MRAPAERRTTAVEIPSLTWAAVALAAGASLLHWMTTSTDTHSWSADAAISLVAGAGLMALAIVLAARPWDDRTARMIYLLGAAGTAVVVVALLLPLLSAATFGHAVDSGQGGHAGHDVGGGDPRAGAAVIRATVEVVLIGVLLSLHRLTGGGPASLSRAAD